MTTQQEIAAALRLGASAGNSEFITVRRADLATVLELVDLPNQPVEAPPADEPNPDI